MTHRGLYTCVAVALCVLGCNTLDSKSDDEPPAGAKPGPAPDIPKVETSDKVDLLFVVDDSHTMVEEQAALREAFPRLIEALISGDGDGEPEHRAVADLHLGVVSTDMGLIGIPDVQGCGGFGDDGVLQHLPNPELASCAAAYPPFLSFAAEHGDDVQQLASDFACIASLGTAGCGYEQPLESALKALWPGQDPFPNTDGSNRVMFMSDPSGFGMHGHGDNQNLGFLRNDFNTGLSIVAVVVVSDEDDCSARSNQLFTPITLLDPNQPAHAKLIKQSPNLRCTSNPEQLFEPSRYVEALRALRPNNQQLVVFAAIVGVPPETVDDAARATTDFTDSAARKQFYAQIREHPQMQLAIDDSGTRDPQDDSLVPSCESSHGKALPPWRLVDVAEGFGRNGLVASICADDFGPAIAAIAGLIGQHLPTR